MEENGGKSVDLVGKSCFYVWISQSFPIIYGDFAEFEWIDLMDPKVGWKIFFIFQQA